MSLSLEASYWRNKSDLMCGATFDGTLRRMESYRIDKVSQGCGIDAKISKYFDAVGTSLELSEGFQLFWMEVLRLGSVINTITTLKTVGLKAVTDWSRTVKTQYDATFEDFGTKYLGSSLVSSRIEALHQKLAFDYSVTPSIVLNISAEHYFNSLFASMSHFAFSANARDNRYQINGLDFGFNQLLIFWDSYLRLLGAMLCHYGNE
jgi:hypothetical protein